jgi:IS30 family transposase
MGAEVLNRRPSSITRELEKGMDKGSYNPVIAGAQHLEAGRNQRPRFKMSDEAWHSIKGQLEKRWPQEEAAKWLKKAYPCYAIPGEIIYHYIFSHERGVKELTVKELRLRGKARKGSKEEEGRGKIPEMTP